MLEFQVDYVRASGFSNFTRLGVPFWGPQDKHYSTLRSMSGYPYLGKLSFQG